MTLTVVAGLALVSAIAFHLGTAILASRHLSNSPSGTGRILGSRSLHVCVIIPVAHLEEVTVCALTSAFRIAYPSFELIFCVPDASDPAARLVQNLIDAHPHVPARLLTGRDNFTFNPKIDNLEKGWSVTAGRDWIVIADSNVLMPRDFIDRLFSAWKDDTALTCSPPIGSDPKTFWADVECAFLNTYQGRLQLASDTLGFGYAHGKAMLFNRELLDPFRGLDTLKFEIAEDSAATKLVRSKGKRVRLVDRPFCQPVGGRTWQDVWQRHLRWAQLRRSSFPVVFALEPLTTSFVPAIAAVVLTHDLGGPVLGAVIMSLGFWIAVEAGLARAAGWPIRTGFVPACLCREAMICVIWATAWFRKGYRWRDNPVNTGDAARSGGIRLKASRRYSTRE